MKPVDAVNREHFDAVLFDLDGVLTNTTGLHAACWKQVFDDLLERRAQDTGGVFQPFDIETDYRTYVDGKDRFDGARDFLASRGIDLPEGSVDPPDDEDSIQGIARRKDALISDALEAGKVEVYESSVFWVRQLRAAGIRTAVVSSSRHCAEVLRAAGLEELFDVRVDGFVADSLALAGKPSPDLFLEAARRLGVEPRRAVVVEDARVGVRAGRAGGFGLVIGVAHSASRLTLINAGADIVVRNLAEMLS